MSMTIGAKFIAGASLVSGLAAGCSVDRSAANMAVLRRMTDAINARDYEALDDLIAPDVHRYSGATPGVIVENLGQFREFLRQDVAAVPDSRVSVGFMFADDDYVAARMTYSGTQRGPIGSFPPSNKPVLLPFIGVLRLEGGKIVEMWVERDNLNMLSQLGHFPAATAVESVDMQKR